MILNKVLIGSNQVR